jgi:hypothetical protein
MGCAQWLTLVITATREAENRRIAFRGQPGKKPSETPSQ